MKMTGYFTEMKIDTDRLFALWSLRNTATQEPWVYAEGLVKDKQGKVIAYVCEPGAEPDFQQVANGEFIAAIRNHAAQLLQAVSDQQGVIERLRARVLRLEAMVYGDKTAVE